MGFPVKFTAAVTGNFTVLDVLIMNVLVPSPGGKVSVTENYSSHGNLIVRFRISALNGTDIKIIYKCTSSGISTSDMNNPSPVEDTVTKNGFKEIKLIIPV